MFVDTIRPGAMDYEIKAYRAPEGMIQLRFTATDEADAVGQATAQGYRVITARRRKSYAGLARTRQHFSVALFSQELLALLEAGLNLVEAIDLLSRKARQAPSQKVIGTLGHQLREGQSFSRALEALPGAFPSLYIATVRSSERTGNLEDSLRRYLAYHQQLNRVRDKVVAALVYPLLLLAVGFLVVLFLLAYVVPRFSQVYEDLGDNLPWLSRALMGWGQFFSQHAGVILAGVGALMALVVYGLTRQSTRAALERMLWSMPALGEKLQLYQLTRFTRTLAMLVTGGIPFVKALDMVGDLLRQPALRHGLEQASRAIREGRAVSDAFGMHQLATEVGIRLLAVGERSGDLGQAMERIAKLYDDEITRAVDWFTRLFEPVLMIGIGLIIGVIVVLMYLPIFELASSIQ